MRRVTTLLTWLSTAAMLFAVGCDDNETPSHNPSHIGSYDQKQYCEELNANLDALQAIIEAQTKYGYAVSSSDIKDKGTTIGYNVEFSTKRKVKIYTSSSTGAPTIQISKWCGDYYWNYKQEILTDNRGVKLKVATNKLTAKIVDDSLYISSNSGFNKNFGYVSGRENIRFFRTVETADKSSSYKLHNGVVLELRKFESDEVPFADKNVAALCVKKWDADGNGYLSYNEAAAVTKLGTLFKENKSIRSFDELKFFTGLREISDSAFCICTSLEKISFPKTVTSIGGWAFNTCRSLDEPPIPDGITTINNYAFRACDFGDIVIPNSVTGIGSYAFFNAGVTSVAFGTKLRVISSYAFAYCKMKSVKIPESVTGIGANPWSFCENLERFDGKYATSDGRFLIVNNEVYSVAPAGMTTCIIPDGVTSLGTVSLEGTPFTKVTMPSSLVRIGHNAFRDCTKLTEITIPKNVSEFGNCPFSDCTGLLKVYCKPTTPPTLDNYLPFQGTSSKLKIYVPKESVEAYKTHEKWSTYASQIEGYDF